MPVPPAAVMNSQQTEITLLDELDIRQNELLEELDRLNQRIEQVIAQWSGVRETPADAQSVPKAA
jgi:restriction endonuclease S subunit